jgi:methylated-DNA-protein-cysteine methyltransferase-like protein
MPITDKSFYQKVYDITRMIPYGKVTTYGLIAESIASKCSARMVGWALNNIKNNLLDIPAHRVVNKYGLLTGKHHFYGSNTMQELLQNEGVIVVNNKIQNFDKVLWIPPMIKI